MPGSVSSYWDTSITTLIFLFWRRRKTSFVHHTILLLSPWSLNPSLPSFYPQYQASSKQLPVAPQPPNLAVNYPLQPGNASSSMVLSGNKHQCGLSLYFLSSKSIPTNINPLINPLINNSNLKRWHLTILHLLPAEQLSTNLNDLYF